MSLVEVVIAHAGEERAVVFHPSAARQSTRIPRIEPLGDAGPPGEAVVLLRAARGEEATSAAELAELIGDRGIGVLALEASACDLPLGRLLAVLGDAEVRVLRAEEVSATETQAVLVLTRDASQPILSYLLGEAVDTRVAKTAVRRDNELQLGGLVRRAVELSAELQGRATAMEAQERLDDLESQLAAALDRMKAAEAELRRRELSTVTHRVRRLGRNLRTSPLGTGSRTLRRLSGRDGGS